MSGDVVDGELSLKTRFSVTCTVSINNKAVCVHDDVWKRCKVSLNFLRFYVNAGFQRNRKGTPSQILFARLGLRGRN